MNTFIRVQSGLNRRTTNRYMASITKFNKCHYLGYYETPLQAAYAYTKEKATYIYEVARMQTDIRLKIALNKWGWHYDSMAQQIMS